MALDPDQKETIRQAFPADRIIFDFADADDYTRDATELSFTPDVLFHAESEEEIVSAVKLCRELNIPIISRGAGTGYSGGALAVNGGLLLSIERLNSIHISEKKRLAIVGPGAVTADIMTAAEKAGLFYPPDPASYEESTIAGNVAENAGGLRCKKYGVTKDYIVSLRGVMPDGEIIECDHRSPFGWPTYDWSSATTL